MKKRMKMKMTSESRLRERRAGANPAKQEDDMIDEKMKRRPLPWFVDECDTVSGYRRDPARIIDDDGYLVADVPFESVRQLVADANAVGDDQEAQRLLLARGIKLV